METTRVRGAMKIKISDNEKTAKEIALVLAKNKAKCSDLNEIFQLVKEELIVRT